jgi:hypothetical protein
MEQNLHHDDYQSLLKQNGTRFEQGQKQAVQAVNTAMVEAYCNIGRYIVEFEQGGVIKAEYGKVLLENLSKNLSSTYGKGFSLSNIYLMMQFFIKSPIFQTLSGKLGKLFWLHNCERLPINHAPTP